MSPSPSSLFHLYAGFAKDLLKGAKMTEKWLPEEFRGRQDLKDEAPCPHMAISIYYIYPLVSGPSPNFGTLSFVLTAVSSTTMAGGERKIEQAVPS